MHLPNFHQIAMPLAMGTAGLAAGQWGAGAMGLAMAALGAFVFYLWYVFRFFVCAMCCVPICPIHAQSPMRHCSSSKLLMQLSKSAAAPCQQSSCAGVLQS